MDSSGRPEVMDFTLKVKSRPFKINDDVYEAVPGIPLQLMASVAKFKKLTTEEGGLDTILTMFDELLFPPSATLWRTRVSERVITIDHLMPLMTWLMEGYGMRPTPPSSDSSDPSTAQDGTSLTDGASPEDSTY